ncbi:hypothetical protein RFI_27530 [Reticulomyxa filosa]|uniref:Uncharacterized protein n=1 Tax=Reticulomyxa filosa TaxID=46433 RepID=X6M890_RETFI|nr:hypothetical protein RFI_27530 [Reticulomyxa filosa]|eukprot:ETO09846.1 hypothetical protein RFI_27530 [Reticulomyxa filosa]
MELMNAKKLCTKKKNKKTKHVLKALRQYARESISLSSCGHKECSVSPSNRHLLLKFSGLELSEGNMTPSTHLNWNANKSASSNESSNTNSNANSNTNSNVNGDANGNRPLIDKSPRVSANRLLNKSPRGSMNRLDESTNASNGIHRQWREQLNEDIFDSKLLQDIITFLNDEGIQATINHIRDRELINSQGF